MPTRSPSNRRIRRSEWIQRLGERIGFDQTSYFPGALVDFVDLVVPELQARGLFRREYEGTTLRDLFGLPRVPAPARHERPVGAQS